jgi:anti-sigma factor NepR-like protein
VKCRGDIKAEMGRQLHAMYRDVISEGVPERFSEILSRLDESRLETQRQEDEKDSDGARR